MHESDCLGRNSVTTKIDDEMSTFVEEQADYHGIPKAEFLRRLLELYRVSQRGELACPGCSEDINLKV
jgi:hypothetical protein